jgi:hypothetical protein
VLDNFITYTQIMLSCERWKKRLYNRDLANKRKIGVSEKENRLLINDKTGLQASKFSKSQKTNKYHQTLQLPAARNHSLFAKMKGNNQFLSMVPSLRRSKETLYRRLYELCFRPNL